MDNEEMELQDSQQPDQEQESQPEEKKEVTLEDYFELEKKNKQLFARLKKVEQEKKSDTLKSNPPASETHEHDYWKEEMELRISGYTEKEAQYLMKNGGKKALEDEFVMAAINAKREEQKATNAAVDTGSSAKSDVEKKYTQDQLSAMSVEELEKILPKA